MVRFFIVEDDRLICEGLRDCFPWRELGAQVCGVCDNGKNALERILAEEVDVVLTDIVLPGMDGIELGKALRERGWPGEMIMMSAFQNVDYVRGALKTQAVDFLFKPVQMSELREGVMRAVERVRNRRAVSPYDETVWREPLGAALETCEQEALLHQLQEAWTILSSGTGDTEVVRARAGGVLAFCRELICLNAAERKLEEALERLENARSVAQLREEYERAVDSLSRVLTENAREWRFAVNVHRMLKEDLQHTEAERLAAALHISRASFYRLFISAFAKSPSEYVLELRMREAGRLLLSTRLRTYEIAERVGYKDVNYFTRLFHQQTGMLPREYSERKGQKE